MLPRRTKAIILTALLMETEMFRMTNAMAMKTLLLFRLLQKRRQLKRQLDSNYTRLLLVLLTGLGNGLFNNRLPLEGVRMWVRPRNSAWWDDMVPLMDNEMWKENFRMSKVTFDLLCQRLTNKFHKKDTNMRRSIPLRKRVAMSLYMLSTLCDFASASQKFGVGKSTLWEAMHHFCACVSEHLAHEFVMFPTGKNLQLALSGFVEDFGFPQCIGAAATCHVPIPLPKLRASDYFNVDKWHSVVMLAACDHAHRFIYLNVEHPGSDTDPKIFAGSHLLQLISSAESGAFIQTIPGTSAPLLLLGPPTFPLLTNMMTPFEDKGNLDPSEQAFNQRHLKAYGTIQDAIRRVGARFPVMSRKPEMKTEYFPGMVQTCCILHNMCEIMGDKCDWDLDEDYVGIRLQKAKRSKVCDEPANSIRNALAKHFQELT